jgi:hypothetical protein
MKPHSIVLAGRALPARRMAMVLVGWLCGAAMMSSSASAATAPVVSATYGADPVAQTTATVSGTVNPNGDDVTDCHVDYGTTVGYGSTAPCAVLPGAGTTDVTVSAPLTSLSPNTVYHFRFVATNAGGTTRALDSNFTTTGRPAPTATTGSAGAISFDRATVSGSVNPNGVSTSCEFQFGATAEYGYETNCTVIPGAGTGPVAVQGTVLGLFPASTYHYRVVATSASGETKGADQTFTSAPLPLPGNGSGSGSGPGNGTVTGQGAGILKLPSSVRVKAGNAAIRLSCTGASACQGTLKLTARIRNGRTTKSISVGKARVHVAAGTSANVTIRLSPAARRALRKSHSLKVAVKGAGVAGTLKLKG